MSPSILRRTLAVVGLILLLAAATWLKLVGVPEVEVALCVVGIGVVIVNLAWNVDGRPEHVTAEDPHAASTSSTACLCAGDTRDK